MNKQTKNLIGNIKQKNDFFSNSRDDKVKSRKISNVSTGSQKSCPNIVTSSPLMSRPTISIEHPFGGGGTYATSSPLAMSEVRQRKTSYGAAVKKMFQSSKGKD
jgi:hypothetical protein